MKRILSIILVALLAVSCCALCESARTDDGVIFDAAIGMLRQMDSRESVEEAQTMFSGIASKYKQSNLFAIYAAAILNIYDGNYDEALTRIEVLGMNQDFVKLLKEYGLQTGDILSMYIEARKLEDNGDYQGALEKYAQMNFYDSADRMVELLSKSKEQKYIQAQTLFEAGYYAEAAEAFEALGNYKDSAEMAKKAVGLVPTPTPTPKKTPTPTPKKTPTPTPKKTPTPTPKKTPTPTPKKTPTPTPKKTPTPSPQITPTPTPNLIARYDFNNSGKSRKRFRDLITLTINDSGDEVSDVQKRLIELGYLKDGADGEYGKKTQKAVYDFQSKNGFSNPSGVASPITQFVLFSSKAIASDENKMKIDQNRGNCLRFDKIHWQYNYETKEDYLKNKEYGYGIVGEVKNTSKTIGILACTVWTLIPGAKGDIQWFIRNETGYSKDIMLYPQEEDEYFMILRRNDTDIQIPDMIRVRVAEVCYSDGQVYHNYDGCRGSLSSSKTDDFYAKFEYYNIDKNDPYPYVYVGGHP